jgi:hypothetical protein
MRDQKNNGKGASQCSAALRSQVLLFDFAARIGPLRSLARSVLYVLYGSVQGCRVPRGPSFFKVKKHKFIIFCSTLLGIYTKRNRNATSVFTRAFLLSAHSETRPERDHGRETQRVPCFAPDPDVSSKRRDRRCCRDRRQQLYDR